MVKNYKRCRRGGDKLVTKKSHVKNKNATLKKKFNAPNHCKAIAEYWDKKKSVAANLKKMGLSSDVNKSIAMPKSRIQAIVEIADLTEALSKGVPIGKPSNPTAEAVFNNLDQQAKQREEYVKSRAGGAIVMPSDVKFCIEMLQRHGEDYEAMARDHLNLNQCTAKQIQRKVNSFKKSKKYKAITANQTMEID